MKSFTIDRDKWIRGRAAWDGHEAGNERDCFSALLTNDGQRCCLGFYQQALGFTDGELRLKGLPHETVDDDAHDDRLPGDWFVGFDEDGNPVSTVIVDRLAEINDATDITEVDRERMITEVFAEQGVEVTFVGGGQ